MTDDERAPEATPAPSDSVEEEKEEDPNARPACFKSTSQEIACVLVLTMGMAQASLSAGACQIITLRIGEALDMTQGQITWINSANSIVAGSCLMLFGSTADTFGRKRQLILGFTLFMIAVLCGGFSTHPIMFHVFRGVTGLGGAMSIPAAVGNLGAIYSRPSSRKNKAFACFSAGNPTGFVLGSIMSGVATNLANWRAPFYVLTVIYGLLAVCAWLVIPDDPQPMKLGYWKELDVIGSAIVTVGLVLVCVALTLAGSSSEGWKTPWIPAVMVIGVVIIAIFIWWEFRVEKSGGKPLMPLYIWKHRTFSLLMMVVSFGFVNFTSGQFWLSLYFQEIRELSALMTAVWLIPQAVSAIVANVIAAFAMSRVDNRILLFAGTLAYATASVLFATQNENTLYWSHAFPGLIVSVWGADLMYCVANMYFMSSLPKKQQSTAGGMFNTILQLSSGVGLSITTAVYNSVAKKDEGKPGLMKGYNAVFWLATALALTTIVPMPWLKIRTQGGKDEEEKDRKDIEARKANSGKGDGAVGETRRGSNGTVEKADIVKKEGSIGNA